MSWSPFLLIMMVCITQDIAAGLRLLRKPGWQTQSTTESPTASITVHTTQVKDNVCKRCTTTSYPCNCTSANSKPDNTTSELNKRLKRDSVPLSGLGLKDGLYKFMLPTSIVKTSLAPLPSWQKQPRFRNRLRVDQKGSVSEARLNQTLGPTGTPDTPCTSNGKMCTKIHCKLKCCDDTPMDDENDSCRHTEPQDCQNGGTFNKKTASCMCGEQFTGTQCQHRKCSITCQNGGECWTNNMVSQSHAVSFKRDYCVCPFSTTGKFCETKNSKAYADPSAANNSDTDRPPLHHVSVTSSLSTCLAIVVTTTLIVIFLLALACFFHRRHQKQLAGNGVDISCKMGLG